MEAEKKLVRQRQREAARKLAEERRKVWELRHQELQRALEEEARLKQSYEDAVKQMEEDLEDEELSSASLVSPP